MLTQTPTGRPSSWLDSAVDVTPLLRAVARLWYVVVAAAVLGAVAAYALSFTATPQFEAASTLYVLAPKTYELAQPEVNVATFQNLLQNQAVVAAIIAEKGLGADPHRITASEFIDDRLTISRMPGSDMLRLSVRLPDARLAADVLEALTARGIALHREVGEREGASVRRNLDEQRREAEARVTAAEGRLAAFRASGAAEGKGAREIEQARLQADVALQSRVLQDVVVQHEQTLARVAANTPQLQVVDPAVVPQAAASPRRSVWAGIGGFLGLLAGLAVVSARPAVEALRS